MSNNLLDGIDIQAPVQEKQQYDYGNVINYLLHLSQGRARDTMELELIQAFVLVSVLVILFVRLHRFQYNFSIQNAAQNLTRPLLLYPLSIYYI